MRKFIISIIVFFFLMLNSIQKVFSQEYTPKQCYGIVYRALTEMEKPLNVKTKETKNTNLNNIFQKYKVKKIIQHRPDGKSKRVKDLFRIELSDNNEYSTLFEKLRLCPFIDEVTLICDEISLETLVESKSNKQINECHLTNEDMNSCNNPIGYNDPLLQGGGDWYLTGMNVPCAWMITQGSPSITVAVVDQFFNNSHSDLLGKFTSIKGNCNPIFVGCGHGFMVAGAVSAIINNNICSAGTGNLTKVAGYCVASDCTSGNPNSGIWQAYQDGHKIISISYSGTGLTTSEAQEMVDNGVTLLVTAFGDNNSNIRQINGVIYVGQADINRNYIEYGPLGDTFSPNMDIFALCVNVPRLQAHNTCAVGSGNTSFGAPSVAGIVALMKAVNPCLSPQDIEHIIKTTHSGLPNNASHYNGLITNGIIDAYAAVQMAQNYQGTNVYISQNTTYNTDKVISGNLIIQAGAELTINSNAIIKFNPNFRILVKRGAKLVLNTATLTVNCGDKWQGIDLEGNPNVGQAASPFIMPSSNQAGTIVLINGATISNAYEGIEMLNNDYPWPEFQNYWGGLVYANNANFINCRRACAFMRNIGVERSQFLNCNFFTENDCVTIWDADGIIFNGNNFNNYTRTGITAYDANVSVENNNVFNGNTTSKSVSLIQTIVSTNASEINNNIFNGGLYGIHSEASNNIGLIKIISNTFNNLYYGTYQSGSTRSEIFENFFNFNTIGSLNLATGSGENRLYRNKYSSGEIGQYFEASNENLSFTENCHISPSNHDVVFYAPPGYPGSVRATQELDFNTEAGNVFAKTGGIASFNRIYHQWGAPWSIFTYKIKINISPTSTKVPSGTFGICNLSYDKPQASLFCEGGGFRPLSNVNEFIFGNVEELPYNKLKELKSQIETLNQEISAKTKVSDPNKMNVLNTLNTDLLQKKDEYNTLRRTEIFKQNTKELKEKMESFIVESESDFDVAIDYFSALVNKSEYHTANKFLDKIHTKSEKEAGFVQAQKINLEWLENPKDYKLTPGKKALLIKFGQQLHPISGYARGIYTKITGEYIEHSHPLPDKGVESRSESKADISEEITLYPNPSDTKLRISLLTGTTDHKIMIISAEGILIKEALVGSNTHYYEMDISDLKPGIYTIQTSGSNKPQVKKFVKL